MNNSTPIIFEGMTSVSALIKAIRSGRARRKINKVYFDSNKIRKEHGRFLFIKNAAAELNFELSILTASEINEIAVGRTHGGILAEVSESAFPDLSASDITEKGFAAIIDGVEDPYSLGYSLRTLYACGCETVILPSHLPAGSDSTLCKASAGASELLNIYVGDLTEIASQYKKCGYKIACAAIPDSVPCYEADLSLPALLIIGGEKRGISSSLLAMHDANIRIPYGRDFMGSLSTASAVSILAYEILRQNTPQ